MAFDKSPKYKDLSLAFRAHPVTGDVTKVYDADAVKQSIKNLIFTMNFEVPFHPEIGSDVTASLFENITPITAITIRKSIENVIKNFEPRVELIYVDVLVDQESGNGYKTRIVYRIINLPETTTLDLFLERKR